MNVTVDQLLIKIAQLVLLLDAANEHIAELEKICEDRDATPPAPIPLSTLAA